jgi:predicted Na+-dependent transporter
LSAGAALVRLLALILLKLVILPISVFAVAHVLAPSWSLGVLLVALMPAGVSSVAFADLHRGNTARALVILFGSSLLCPFTIPAGMLLGQSWTRGERVTIDPMELLPRVLFIAALLAVPFVLAQWVRRAARSWVDANQTKFSPVALALLAAMVFAATAATREQWLSLGFLALATPMALVFAATAAFLLCGVALSRVLSREDAVAFACSAVYMNNGLCVAFALAFFPGLPGMILPGVLMTIPMVLGISLVGRAIPPAS